MLPMRKNSAWLPSMFSDFFDTDFMPKANATAPAINVMENDKEYKVELAAPGTSKDDFDVQLNENGDLHVKLETKTDKRDEDKNAHYLRREFSYTRFEQTLLLPEDVDREKITAKVEHGVLTVNLPKVEPVKVKIGRKVEIA